MLSAVVTIAAWVGVAGGIAVALAIIWPRKRKR
jgi:hypothetical protein